MWSEAPELSSQWTLFFSQDEIWTNWLRTDTTRTLTTSTPVKFMFVNKVLDLILTWRGELLSCPWSVPELLDRPSYRLKRLQKQNQNIFNDVWVHFGLDCVWMTLQSDAKCCSKPTKTTLKRTPDLKDVSSTLLENNRRCFLFSRGSRTQNYTRRFKSQIQILIIRKQTDCVNLCGSMNVFMLFEPLTTTSRKRTKTGRVKQNPFKIKWSEQV